MNRRADPDNVLLIVSRVLLRCVLMGFLLLFVWFGAFLAVGDFAYDVHAKMFDISRHEFDVMNYYGMTIVKGCVVLFFLVPLIATRLVLTGIEKSGGGV